LSLNTDVKKRAKNSYFFGVCPMQYGQKGCDYTEKGPLKDPNGGQQGAYKEA
jgi:hypothetical protein